MLINLANYHRPRDLQNALYLLRRPIPRTVPLAGGSALLGSDDPSVEAVVDLQRLGLRYIRTDADPNTVRLGAMATIADVSGSDAVRIICGGIVAQAGRLSAASVIRNQATVGGCVAVADAADPLLVALLACDARLTIHMQNPISLTLTEFLHRRADYAAGHVLITEVSIAQPEHRTAAALTRVGRSPADSPIVCAAVVLSFEGDVCADARLALGGVSEMPLRLPQAESMLIGQPLSPDLAMATSRQISQLVDPVGDFRGSSEYRRAMADMLSVRAIAEVIAQLE